MTVRFDYETKLQELIEDYKKKVSKLTDYSDICDLQDDLEDKVNDLKYQLQAQADWILRSIGDELFQKQQEAKYTKEEKENE